ARSVERRGQPWPEQRRAWRADLERLAPQIVTVQFDQIEGVEEDARVIAAVAQPLKAWHAGVVATHRLAIDDAGGRAEPYRRLGDEREAIGQAIARAAIEPHLVAVLAGDDTEAFEAMRHRLAVAALWWAGMAG